MSLPPIAIYLYRPASLRHDVAKGLAKAMPSHPIKESEATLRVHGFDIAVGVVAVFPRPLERGLDKTLRQIRTDIAILEAELGHDDRVAELRCQAVAIYQVIGFDPEDARPLAGDVTIEGCLTDLASDARKVRDLDLDADAGEHRELIDELAGLYRQAERLFEAMGHDAEAAQILAIQLLAERLDIVGTELPHGPVLTAEQRRRLDEIAGRLDAHRFELAAADLAADENAVDIADIRLRLAALYAQAEKIYQAAGLDQDSARAFARALR